MKEASPQPSDEAGSGLLAQGLVRPLTIGVLFGVVVVVGVMLYSDVSALLETVVRFDAKILLPALALVSLGYGLRWLKWEVYLRCLALRLPALESMAAFLAGMVMGITPGKLGEVLKSFLLRRSRGIPVARTAPIVVAERLTDLAALILLMAYGVSTSGHGVWVCALAIGLTVGLLVAAAWPPAGRVLVSMARRMPVLKRAVPALEEALGSMSQLVGGRALLSTTFLSVLAWGCECVATYLILSGFPGVEVTLATATFVFAFATVAGALSLLPGGMIATEGSMVALLQQTFRVTPNAQVAGAATLMIRFCTLWFGVIVGGLALWIHGRIAPHSPPKSLDVGVEAVG
jgi:uncharacterized membrane protein YbhN (UPF0104 family)